MNRVIKLVLVVALTCGLYRPATGADTTPETETVEVTGTGKTIEDAEKDAWIKAVQKVVGVYVDTEIFVKNEDIIHDQILSASRGFITSFEVTSKPRKRRQDDLYETTIKAVVEKGRVAEHLRKAKIPLVVVPIDGKELYAEVFTGEKKVQDSRALLTKYFTEIPAKLLMARFVDTDGRTGAKAAKPKVKRDDSTGKVWCAWNIEVSCDRNQYYREHVEKLQKVLEISSERKGVEPIRIKTPVRHSGQNQTFELAMALTGTRVRWWPSPRVEEPFRSLIKYQDAVVLLNTKSDASNQNQEFHWYVLNKARYGTLIQDAFGSRSPSQRKPMCLQIRLVHNDGSEILQQKLPLSETLVSDSRELSKVGWNASAQHIPVNSSLPLAVRGGPLGTVTPQDNLLRLAGSERPNWSDVDLLFLTPEFRLAPVQFMEGTFALRSVSGLCDSLLMHYECAISAEDLKELKEVQLGFLTAGKE